MSVAQQFTDHDRSLISAAVAAAECRTSAEIVPVVVGSSGRYDRAEDICGLWLGLILMVLTWVLLPSPIREAGDWSGISLAWYPFVLAVAVLVGFIAGVVLSDRVPPLRRMFTPSAQMRDEVSLRSRQLFFDQRVHHTDGARGLLLFVSLFEHQAAIVADQKIIEILGQERIDELCRHFTDRLKRETVTGALCETIGEVGELLHDALPPTGGDVNELPDALVTFECL